MACTSSISSVARTSASLQRLMVRRVRLAALSCSSTRMRSAISASSLSFVASCNFKGMFPCEEKPVVGRASRSDLSA